MPKIVDKRKKADDIAQAGLGVFRDHGYHGAKMADIAAAAGVGKGTLYEYFPDKAAILNRAFDRYFEAFTAGVMAAMADAQSPRAKLLALLDFALGHVDEWQEHCAVYVDYFARARTDEESLFSLKEMYQQFESLLAALIKEGQQQGEIRQDLDPAATAELLLSLYDGVILRGVLVSSIGRSPNLRSTAMTILEAGMGEEPSCSATSS